MSILIERERVFEILICRMNRATANAERAIDEAMEFVEASNRRIALMESQARDRRGRLQT